jgi:hypothetical protein
MAALRANPRGIRLPLETAYEKYRGAGFTVSVWPAAYARS